MAVPPNVQSISTDEVAENSDPKTKKRNKIRIPLPAVNVCSISSGRCSSRIPFWSSVSSLGRDFLLRFFASS